MKITIATNMILLDGAYIPETTTVRELFKLDDELNSVKDPDGLFHIKCIGNFIENIPIDKIESLEIGKTVEFTDTEAPHIKYIVSKVLEHFVSISKSELQFSETTNISTTLSSNESVVQKTIEEDILY